MLKPLSSSTPALRDLGLLAVSALSLPLSLLMSVILSPGPTNQVKALHLLLLKVQRSPLQGVVWLGFLTDNVMAKKTKKRRRRRKTFGQQRVPGFAPTQSEGKLMRQKNYPGTAPLFLFDN